MSGESEAKVRELFEEAKKPCIIFIDEIDAITPKRETAQKEKQRRIVAQLLTSMDDISLENTGFKPVLVIGATNGPYSIDPALRRAGRFDREIKLGIPTEEARCKILQVFSQKLRIRGDFDFLSVARKTPGYVGADLKALVREAASVAIESILSKEASEDEALYVESGIVERVDFGVGEEGRVEVGESTSPSSSIPNLPSQTSSLSALSLENVFIEEQGFVSAIPKVQPSAKREGFALVPDTTWNDIGALAHIREELRMSIVQPLRHPEKFKAAGIISPVGLLLWGPPGCVKTLLAKAIANESDSNFISIKGPGHK